MVQDKEEIYKEINMSFGYNKPNGVIYVYSMISYLEEVFRGVRYNITITKNEKTFISYNNDKKEVYIEL